MLCSLFTVIGALWAAVWLYDNLRSPLLLLLGCLRRTVDGRKLSDRYGKWAVITGSSDGIGKGYAQYLARKGMNVMLLSRTESKLQRVTQELQAKYGIEARYIAVDFAKGEEVYAALEKALLPLDIGILVNNVGLANEIPEYVHEATTRVLWDMINVNVGAATALCRMLVPAMRERGRGLIINISSIASAAPAPFLTTYAATKAYMTSFSLALAEELRADNVQVQTVCPGIVHTNLTDVMVAKADDRTLSTLMLGVDQYMKFACCTIGKCDATTGHWIHGLQLASIKLLPVFVRTKLLMRLYQRLRNEFAAKRNKSKAHRS